MRLSATSSETRGETFFYNVLRFEPDEVRYLCTHLKGGQPKLTFQGTIGQGLTVWFEEKGKTLALVGDGMEGRINVEHIGGYQGKRPPMRPRYERSMVNGKPVIKLEPVIAYDRDADKLALFKDGALKTDAFNPALPPPKQETAPVVVAPAPLPPKPAPTPDKPKLSPAQVAEIAARHSVPPIGANGHHYAPPKPAPAVAPAALATARPAIPARVSGERTVNDIRELVAMMNAALQESDDLVLDIAADRRSLCVKRIRVLEEAL